MVSPAPDGLEVQVALGLLAALDGWDVLTYAATGTYEPDAERPAYLGADDPVGAPDERVLVTPRPFMPERGRVVLVPVGIAWRGAIDAEHVAGVNFLALLERRLYRLPPQRWGSVSVTGARRADAGGLPRDAQRRPRAAATYLFRCRMATASN